MLLDFKDDKNMKKETKNALSRLKILEGLEKKNISKLEKEVEQIKEKRSKMEEAKLQKEQEVILT